MSTEDVVVPFEDLPADPFGIGRLRRELGAIGYPTKHRLAENIDYAEILNYEIPIGRFANMAIGLALPAPPDFPASIGASIHVRANPCLVPLGNVPNVRNIVESKLGQDWQYWSFRFPWEQRDWQEPNAAKALFARVRQVFANV